MMEEAVSKAGFRDDMILLGLSRTVNSGDAISTSSRRRIALVRAMMKNAPLLILDGIAGSESAADAALRRALREKLPDAAILYAVTMSAGKLRRCETYVGGERLQDVYIRDEEPGPGRHLEVTGVDFYKAIEQLPGLRRLYALARRQIFDVYALGARSAVYLVTVLRGAHTGALPLYLVWVLAGLLVLLFAITRIGA